ncbi:uncharacterized protein LOC127252981 [Andrographis paniculata]|uniref:uncharacterized protein LOC127252981 n=1 Tax=Andrographis paniculata TaxID=175694 RepID=UPI0021E827C3|nr:uncharacterized protein LOC127252981 [Andrographis paniculata]
MASTNGGRHRLDKKNSSLLFMQMTPPHGWKEDSHFHYLRITLPGFKTNNVTIHMDKYGHLVVRGDRQISEHKYISFEETFDVPKNGDLENASGVFENDQVYCITIPKKQQQQQQQNGRKKEEKKKQRDVHPNPYDQTQNKSFFKNKLATFIIVLPILALVVGLILKFSHE